MSQQFSSQRKSEIKFAVEDLLGSVSNTICALTEPEEVERILRSNNSLSPELLSRAEWSRHCHLGLINLIPAKAGRVLSLVNEGSTNEVESSVTLLYKERHSKIEHFASTIASIEYLDAKVRRLIPLLRDIYDRHSPDVIRKWLALPLHKISDESINVVENFASDILTAFELIKVEEVSSNRDPIMMKAHKPVKFVYLAGAISAFAILLLGFTAGLLVPKHNNEPSQQQLR